MNKKILVLLFASLFLFTLISADTCTPDSGYNKCYHSTYKDDYGSCYSRSDAKVMGNNDIQVENGDIEYSGGKYYATGDTYIKYKIEARYGLIYENKEWDYIWDQYDCSKNGCSFDNYEQGKFLRNDNRYYLTKGQGDSYSGCPVFVAFDHDLTEKSSCWIWTYAYQGWGWTGNGGCKEVEQVECLSGKDKCEGDNYYKCENYEWNNKGVVGGECGAECTPGKTKCESKTFYECNSLGQWDKQGIVEGECGVECKGDADCPSDTYTSTNYCDNDNVVKDFKTYSCSDYKCESSETQEIQEECDYGCENGECLNLEEPDKPELSSLESFFQGIWEWFQKTFS